MRYLRLRKITATVHYAPIHLYHVFGGINADLPITERERPKVLTLRLYPDIDRL
jgi:hypothetical protein